MGFDEVAEAQVEFGARKRLGQKIVRPGRQPGELGGLVRPGGEEDDRNGAGGWTIGMERVVELSRYAAVWWLSLVVVFMRAW